MGSTQLLLLVLVLIIVSLAIFLSVDSYNDNAASANLDRVTAFLVELGIRAQKYYQTPVWLGGGGRSFSGITADDQGMAILTNVPTSDIGTFTVIMAGTATQVTLQGIGVEDGDRDGTNCTATCQVFSDSMATTILNR